MVTDEFKHIVDRIRSMAGISHRASYFVDGNGIMCTKEIPVQVIFNPKTGCYLITCPGNGVTVTISFTDINKSVGYIYQYLMLAGYISSCVW